ncbi:hypothetical protein SNE40_003283 [Patella caerulea]
MLGLGCILKYNSDLLNHYLEPMLEAFRENGYEVSLTDLYEAVSVILIGLGSAILTVGSLGCCGACCKLKSFIITYTVIVLAVTIAEIVCAVLLFTMRKEMESTLQPMLQASIRNSYTGDAGVDVTTLGFNFLFTEWDCCGVHNYTDLHLATKWDRSVMLYGFQFTMAIPLMCCKLDGTFPNMVIPKDALCALYPHSSNSNYHKGCYAEVEKSINKYQYIIIGSGIGVLVLEIGSIIASIYLFKELLFLKRKLLAVTPRTPRVWGVLNF